ncbi:Putative inner membrane protein [Salmonella enterica subsp. enterica serovar Mississippi str. A4-633]|nr:Putative inner membrane protein [Salmonella enterica subsp. enterica serovar Mississippi str. A4-633]
MKQSGQDKGTLLLALIAGLSINGTFAALFSAIVPFSVFPIISLVLTVYCLHQRYQNRTMPVGLPGLAAACFILGVLLYSTVVRAEYPDISTVVRAEYHPDIGSNFFPAVLSVILVFWIGFKLRNRKQDTAE